MKINLTRIVWYVVDLCYVKPAVPIHQTFILAESIRKDFLFCQGKEIDEHPCFISR